MYIDIFHTQNTDAKILHNNFESRAPLLRPQVTNHFMRPKKGEGELGTNNKEAYQLIWLTM